MSEITVSVKRYRSQYSPSNSKDHNSTRGYKAKPTRSKISWRTGHKDLRERVREDQFSIEHQTFLLSTEKRGISRKVETAKPYREEKMCSRKISFRRV